MAKFFVYAYDPKSGKYYVCVVINLVAVFAYNYNDCHFHYHKMLSEDFCYNHELEYTPIHGGIESIDFLIDIGFGSDTIIEDSDVHFGREDIVNGNL